VARGSTRPIRDAGLAVSLLTMLPTAARWPEGEQTGVAAWFPATGLVVGGAGWAFVHALELAGWRGGAVLVVSALVLAIWAVITRMLHWDGLADYADGLWGGDSPTERLRIMADSHTGAFGATAIALFALVQFASVGSVLAGGHEMPLLLVPAVARLAATCAAWLGSPAREGGLGRSVMGRPQLVDVMVAGIVVGTAAALLFQGFGPSGVALAVAGVVLALAVPHVLSGPTGGVTGDVMGASVLVCETALLALAALMWGA
jgi:adenosylcobinamide-GDP ribazoletransferase